MRIWLLGLVDRALGWLHALRDRLADEPTFVPGDIFFRGYDGHYLVVREIRDDGTIACYLFKRLGEDYLAIVGVEPLDLYGMRRIWSVREVHDDTTELH